MLYVLFLQLLAFTLIKFSNSFLEKLSWTFCFAKLVAIKMIYLDFLNKNVDYS